MRKVQGWRGMLLDDMTPEQLRDAIDEMATENERIRAEMNRRMDVWLSISNARNPRRPWWLGR